MGESTATPGRSKKHRNGQGSFYKDSAGRWRGAFFATDPVTHKRRRFTVGASTYAEVARKVEERKGELNQGIDSQRSDTVEQYLTRWLSMSRTDVRASSWRQREQNVRLYIVPALGSLPLVKLTPADVKRMTDGMIARGLSATSAIGARITLRKALADAEADELVHRNVARLAKPPRMEHREIEYLDAVAMRRLLTFAEGRELGPMITLAASTGLRQGEILGLAWDSVDLEARRLTVRRALARSHDGGWTLAEPKTKRSRRTIHLPSVAVAALRDEARAQAVNKATAGAAWQDRDGLVFTDAVGRPLRGTNVTHAFQDLLAKAGIPRVSFHALRHSAASAWLAAGVPLRTISDTLGHSTLAITADLYAHLGEDLRRDAADAMDRVLGGAS